MRGCGSSGGRDDRALAGGERGLHPGHHRGRRSHPGAVQENLGRAGARSLPPPDPPEASGRRPGFSPDDAVLLPDRARDVPCDDDRAAWLGRYYVADHITNRLIVLERNPYYRGGRIANPDRILWTIEPDANARLLAVQRDQHDYVLLFNFPDTVVRDLVEEYGLNRRVFRFPPSSQETKFLFTFNQKRSAFRGAGQAPLRKAINFVIDRPELVRTHGFLAVRRSDRLLAAALSDSRRLYPLGGTNPVAAGRWLARAGHTPKRLTLYTDSFPWSVKSAQVFIFNMRQLGIEVEPHYFAFLTLQEKLATPGEPWDVAGVGIDAVYPDPAGVFVPLLRGTRYEARVNAANRLRGADRAKAWADLETELMRDDPPVAAYGDWRPLFFVSRSFGCWGQELDFAAVCKK